MGEFIEENKKKLLILGVLFGILIIFLIISNILKKDKYIYTLEKNRNSSLPYINIENEDISNINNYLKDEFDSIVSYNNDSYMKYEYSKQGDLISLLVEKGIRGSEDSFLEVQYETYNISLETKKIYEIDELLIMYNLDKQDIYNNIYMELEKQYNKEVQEGYLVKQQCDFECFIESKDFTSVDKNVKLFVKNNKVYGYLNTQNASMFYSIDDYPKMNKIYELN